MLIIIVIIFLFILLSYLFYKFFYNDYEFFINDVIPNATDIPFATNSPLYIDYILANSQILIPTTNELAENPQITFPIATSNPIDETNSQLSLLTKLKNENTNLQDNIAEQQQKLRDIKEILLSVQVEIEKKELEKLKLSEQVSNMENAKFANNSIIELILKGINANMDKESELLNLKKEIELKKEKIEKLLLEPIAPVIIKDEQINPLMDKLKEIEKKFEQINNKLPNNNICSLSSNMPEPKKEDFINDINQIQNPSYLWCMCNDENKNSSSCIDYMDCSKNYLKNKDKTALINDDLILYMKCLSKYSNFPNYLSTNNNK